MLGGMKVSELEDSMAESTDTVRLRTDVYDALAKAKGYPKPDAQAAWHGIARSAMFRLRAGGVPRLDTAMRIAADCGVPVEVIWERVAA